MYVRVTRDLCLSCWQDVHPDQYAPESTRYGGCDRCGDPFAMVTRSVIEDEERPETSAMYSINPSA